MKAEQSAIQCWLEMGVRHKTRSPSFPTAQAWLEHYAIPIPESGCWLYTGFVFPTTGYGGNLHLDGVKMAAHRASYIRFYGPIPKGMFVCHSCDVPSCINPKHLFVGTHTDNMRDMLAKGRWRPPVKTHCKLGHELIQPAWGGQRICRICTRANKNRRNAEIRAEIRAARFL